MSKSERLTGVLEKTGLDNRSKLILALDPGCLFGFPSPDLGELIKRVDCLVCQEIMATAYELSGAVSKLNEAIANFCRPVRERNESLQKKYEAKKKIPIVGRLFNPPRPEPEPEYKNTPWYIELAQRIEELKTALESLEKQDVAHWHDEKERKISEKVVALFVTKDVATYISGLRTP